MILVTGAGGKTGRMLIKALSNVESVCAFVHREEQVPRVKSLGAEKVLVGDMRDGVAIRASMQGARAVYHICPNMSPDEELIGKLVLKAVLDSGVEHLVYHSVLHPQTEKMPHHWAKLRVEEIIFESDLPYTIMQPAPYMQNLLANWKSILEDGVLRIPYSINSKFSFVDLEDVAEAAGIVVNDPNHYNTIYELSGTMPMSHVEVAYVFERLLDIAVQAVKEDIGDWKRRASTTVAKKDRDQQQAEYAIENLVRMFEYYDRWGLAGNSNCLRWLLQRQPNSLESFIERTVKEHNVLD